MGFVYRVLLILKALTVLSETINILRNFQKKPTIFQGIPIILP